MCLRSAATYRYVAHLFLKEILASPSQALAPFLDVSQGVQHVSDFRFAVLQQLDETVTLLSQSRDLSQMFSAQAVLLMFRRQRQRREVVMELL